MASWVRRQPKYIRLVALVEHLHETRTYTKYDCLHFNLPTTFSRHVDSDFYPQTVRSSWTICLTPVFAQHVKPLPLMCSSITINNQITWIMMICCMVFFDVYYAGLIWDPWMFYSEHTTGKYFPLTLTQPPDGDFCVCVCAPVLRCDYGAYHDHH